MTTASALRKAEAQISEAAPAPCRYPGSPPFQDDDLSRLLFFGRENEAEALLNKILVEDLVVLYGRSGLGKTSLINAGVVQPLRERNFFPVVCRVQRADTTKEDPWRRFTPPWRRGWRQRKAKGSIADYREGEKTTLWEYFKTLEVWSAEDILLTPVVILDQFEELFTLYGRRRRQALTEQLGDLVRGSIPPEAPKPVPARGGPGVNRSSPIPRRRPKVKVLIAMREEFLGQLADLAKELPAIRKNEFRLTPLQREEAEQAIVKPAQVDHPGLSQSPSFAYAPEKLKEILDFLCNPEESREGVEENEVDPSQLQILCQYIEEKVENRGPGALEQRYGWTTRCFGKEEMRAAIQNFYDREHGEDLAEIPEDASGKNGGGRVDQPDRTEAEPGRIGYPTPFSGGGGDAPGTGGSAAAAIGLPSPGAVL